MRNPAWAGKFYHRDSRGLNEELDSCFRGVSQETLPMAGAVVPHAGYMYSGAVAAEVYARLPRRETYVIIGPNHSDPRNLMAAMSRDSWRTPLGTIDVDQDLASALAGSIIDIDEMAHAEEHSIEVQLPFLQKRFSQFRILPISLGGFQDQHTALDVGRTVAKAILDLKKDCTIIASSDFSHYKPHEVARRVDAKLIESILSMDVAEFYNRLSEYDATACGYGPIAATITSSKLLGATSGKLLRYATSGDVTGDYSQVVGYGAIAFA
jgi:AmmeMemoRadiSam system protein B